MDAVYKDLARRLIAKVRDGRKMRGKQGGGVDSGGVGERTEGRPAPEQGRQLWVAIAGAPGSGKTTLAVRVVVLSEGIPFVFIYFFLGGGGRLRRGRRGRCFAGLRGHLADRFRFCIFREHCGSRFKTLGIFFNVCVCFFCALFYLSLEPVLLDVELSSTTKHICAHGHANLLPFGLCGTPSPPSCAALARRPQPRGRPALFYLARHADENLNETPYYLRRRSAGSCKRSTPRCACPWMVFTSTGAGAVTVRDRGSSGDALYMYLSLPFGNPIERFSVSFAEHYLGSDKSNCTTFHTAPPCGDGVRIDCPDPLTPTGRVSY